MPKRYLPSDRKKKYYQAQCQLRNFNVGPRVHLADREIDYGSATRPGSHTPRFFFQTRGGKESACDLTRRGLEIHTRLLKTKTEPNLVREERLPITVKPYSMEKE